MTGLVGFGGGIRGFFKRWTGRASPGFLIFAALAVPALVGILAIKTHWRGTWTAANGARI